MSREELIRTCWNGTVVGEDSINRTISVLRKALQAIERDGNVVAKPQMIRIEKL